jgi:NAD(P)-dependent dehydrogenase (short-subunit alcohol dehydrogenase family)
MARRFTLVTGASRGLGRAIAYEAARDGHDLALVARNEADRLDEVRSAATASGSGHVSVHLCDVSDAAAVAKLFRETARHAPLTGLVNCAGYAGERFMLAEAPLEMIDRILAVNLRGTILCCREIIGQMSRLTGGHGGAIVNLSSQTARFGGDRLAAYAASKAAIDGLTISLAREVAPAGIRVNAVSPGAVLTEPLRALPAEKLESMQAAMPMGRFCEPEEVARTVLWLLSDSASYVSGAIVPVHGAR